MLLSDGRDSGRELEEDKYSVQADSCFSVHKPMQRLYLGTFHSIFVLNEWAETIGAQDCFFCFPGHCLKTACNFDKLITSPFSTILGIPTCLENNSKRESTPAAGGPDEGGTKFLVNVLYHVTWYLQTKAFTSNGSIQCLRQRETGREKGMGVG